MIVATYRNIFRVILSIVAVMVILAIWVRGLTLDLTGAAGILISCATGIACGQIARPENSVWLARMLGMVECLGLMTLTTLLGAIASYVAASLSHGFIDADLAAWDARMGIDWHIWWNYAVRHPTLWSILTFGYTSIFYSPIVLLIALNMAGRRDEAFRFMLAFLLALVMTDILFAFAPAKSAVVHFLGADPIQRPWAGQHIAVIEGLRSGQLQAIPIAGLRGLISFPSFHTASAILFVWGAWRLAWLRLPALLINLDMVIATPLMGEHYYIDLIGGAAVAIFGILAASRVFTLAALFARVRVSNRKVAIPTGGIVPLG